MKFGYFLRKGVTYDGMVDLAQHTEALGLHGAYLNDHVIGLFREETRPFLEAMKTCCSWSPDEEDQARTCNNIQQPPKSCTLI